MTTVIWQVLNLFTLTPSNENLHRPSSQNIRECCLWSFNVVTLKWRILHIRHFWMKCKYAAAINDKNAKIQSTGLTHLQSPTCVCWVKSQKWPMYCICPNWGWMIEEFRSFFFNSVKGLWMCEVCLEIMYPGNCWRSWFINQTYSIVQMRPPAIHLLSTNKPTAAPPGFSLSDTSVLLRGHWMLTSTRKLGLWLIC